MPLLLMFKVQIRVQLHCRPLSEDKFRPVIADNYYHHNHFWFELDHGQTSQLIALLQPLAIAPANSVPQNMNQVTVLRSLPWHDPSWKAKSFKMPESEFEQYHSSRSSMISGSNESDLLDECFQPLDTHSVDKVEATQNETDAIWMKLKEISVAHPNHSLSWENNVNDAPYANESWSEGKQSIEQEENPSSPLEKEENPCSPSEKEYTTCSSFEKEENTGSPLKHQYNIAQVVENV